MTKLELINLALGLVGANRVSSLTDTTPELTFALSLYDAALEEVLKVAPWSFATSWQELVASAASADVNGLQPFEIPDQTVQVHRVSDGTQDYGIRWRMGDDRSALFIDATAAWAEVTRFIDIDAVTVPGDFALAVGYRLAALLCVPLTENIQREEQLTALFVRQSRIAALKDGKQGSSDQRAPSYLKPGRITLARY